MPKREPYTVTSYEIQQIIPAPPDAVAVYAEDGEAFGDPIIAWGVFDTVEEHFDETGRRTKTERTREAGPLVMDETCALAPPWASSNFAGVRIGARTWVRLGTTPSIPEPDDSPFRTPR